MNEELTKQLDSKFEMNIDKNVEKIKYILEESVDLIQRDLVFHKRKKVEAVCFYTDGLVNTQVVNLIIQSLIYKADLVHPKMDEVDDPSLLIETLKTSVMMNHSLKPISKIEDAIVGILSGDTLVIIDHSDTPLLVSTRGWDTRSVEEPQTEQVVRGPRDGFTESIRTNTALVRRRIRDPQFRIETMRIGTKSKTDVNIAYLKGTVKKGLVEEVKTRLERIKIDGILDSGYIEELIGDAPFSPFTTVQSTERPDKVAASIFEGRVAIFVDNSPFVLIVPTYFWQFLQASDDYYTPYLSGSFFRLIRYMAFVISLTLPSIFVMLVSFHQEMIPTPLALTIASGRDVIPFPVLLEAIIMEISFELMREAGLRMPKPIGQAVSIVGSLVIGQAAVQAGIISPSMVIVVAVTGIASFAIPNVSAAFSIRLIRFPLLIASGTFGLLGFATIFSILALHAMSIRSFGESYLAPATPFLPSDQKDTLFRMPWWNMKELPKLAQGKDNHRIGENQIPKPPDQVDPGSEKQNSAKDKQNQQQQDTPKSPTSFKNISKKRNRKWRGTDEK